MVWPEMRGQAGSTPWIACSPALRALRDRCRPGSLLPGKWRKGHGPKKCGLRPSERSKLRRRRRSRRAREAGLHAIRGVSFASAYSHCLSGLPFASRLSFCSRFRVKPRAARMSPARSIWASAARGRAQLCKTPAALVTRGLARSRRQTTQWHPSPPAAPRWEVGWRAKSARPPPPSRPARSPAARR